MQKYLLLASFFIAGCATIPSDVRNARAQMAREIAAEPPGDYFIGRRYFKPTCKFWGYVRRPGAGWASAVLVVLNENRQIAPDRAQLGPGTGRSYEKGVGFDNNYEYRLEGYFSGDKVYELVSNSIYPEFVLTGYELRSTRPAPIFPSQLHGARPNPAVIEKPE